MYGAYSRQDDKERQSLGGGLLERLVPPVQMYDEPSRPISISDANPNALQMFKDVRQCFSDKGENKANTTGIPDGVKWDSGNNFLNNPSSSGQVVQRLRIRMDTGKDKIIWIKVIYLIVEKV